MRVLVLVYYKHGYKLVVVIASHSRSFSDSYLHFVDFFAINCSKPNLFEGDSYNILLLFVLTYLHQYFEIHSHLHMCMCIRTYATHCWVGCIQNTRSAVTWRMLSSKCTNLRSPDSFLLYNTFCTILYDLCVFVQATCLHNFNMLLQLGLKQNGKQPSSG